MPVPVPAPPPPSKMAVPSPGPEAEVFSTPPSSPCDFTARSGAPLEPSLTRKNSRPSNLHIAHFVPDVVVDDQNSPHQSHSVNALQMHARNPRSQDILDTSSTSSHGSSSDD